MRYKILIDQYAYYHLVDIKYNRISSSSSRTVEGILNLNEYSPIPNGISIYGHGYAWFLQPATGWGEFSTLATVYEFESIEQFINNNPEHFI